MNHPVMFFDYKPVDNKPKLVPASFAYFVEFF